MSRVYENEMGEKRNELNTKTKINTNILKFRDNKMTRTKQKKKPSNIVIVQNWAVVNFTEPKSFLQLMFGDSMTAYYFA